MITKKLITAAQDFTANWVDLGAEIDTAGKTGILLWPEIDINDSLNCRIRAKFKFASDSALEFDSPIRSTEAAVVKYQPHYYELDVDGTDQNIPLHWVLYGLVPVVQFQIQAGTVGASAGNVKSAWYTTKEG